MRNKLLSFVIAIILVSAMFTGCANTEEMQTLLAVQIEDASLYTPKSYAAYLQAVETATAIADKSIAFQSEVDAAANSLRDSIDGLTLRADKTGLIQAKEDALKIDTAQYLPISCSALNDAISNAATVIGDDNASESDVTSAINAINKATTGLIFRPDKASLVEKHTEAEAIDTSPYLAASVEPLTAAIANANAAINNANATLDDVNTAIQKIDTAIAGLELKPDKTALSDLINKANAFKEEKYTTVTYNVLKEAIPRAEKVNNNSEATQAEVTSAIAFLQEAVDGLVKSKKCVWRISTSLRKTATNHVGNDWSSGVYYKGDLMNGSFEVTAKEGSTIKITGKAVEHDNVPDVGSGSVSLVLRDGNEAETTFYVRENRGKYSGNRAVWVLVVSCVLVERV